MVANSFSQSLRRMCLTCALNEPQSRNDPVLLLFRRSYPRVGVVRGHYPNCGVRHIGWTVSGHSHCRLSRYATQGRTVTKGGAEW